MLKLSLVILKLFLFKLIMFSFNFFNIITLDFILQYFPRMFPIFAMNLNLNLMITSNLDQARAFYHYKSKKINSDLKMTCKQKLCKRTASITSSGNCSVCQNAIDEAVKKIEKTRKTKHFEKVDVDFNLMVETHKKLEQGIRVDPVTLNVLVLSGIMNILRQSEALEEAEERVKILE